MCDDRDGSAFYPAFLSLRRARAPRAKSDGAIFNAGDDLQQVRGALLVVERAYWFVTCEIVTSGPRSPRVAAVPPRRFPRDGSSCRLTMAFVVDVAPDELGNARERLFGQRKKGRVGKARNDVERSCDKTWAILTPRSAHLAMKNAGASIRIGRLGKYDAR